MNLYDCEPTDPIPTMDIRIMYAEGGNSILIEYGIHFGVLSWCFMVKQMEEAQ